MCSWFFLFRKVTIKVTTVSVHSFNIRRAHTSLVCDGGLQSLFPQRNQALERVRKHIMGKTKNCDKCYGRKRTATERATFGVRCWRKASLRKRTHHGENPLRMCKGCGQRHFSGRRVKMTLKWETVWFTQKGIPEYSIIPRGKWKEGDCKSRWRSDNTGSGFLPYKMNFTRDLSSRMTSVKNNRKLCAKIDTVSKRLLFQL